MFSSSFRDVPGAPQTQIRCVTKQLLKRGYDWGEWMSNFFDWVNNLFNPNKPKKGKSIKE